MVDEKMKTDLKEDKVVETKEKIEVKSEKKKEISKTVKVRKELAIANGISLRISPKYAFSVCKVIKGKSPEEAIKRLEDVLSFKRVIPMAGREVAHQKGKGIAGAKFPKNACIEIIKVIKQGIANAEVLEIENPVISIAQANRASAPLRKGGRKSKRTHIHLEFVRKTSLAGKRKLNKTKGKK